MHLILGSHAHQTQSSTVPKKALAGPAGVAGCPEQKMPEQGSREVGASSDRPARSALSRSIEMGCRARLLREVTR